MAKTFNRFDIEPIKKQLTAAEVGDELFDNAYDAYLSEQVEEDLLRTIRAGNTSSYDETATKRRVMVAKRAKMIEYDKVADRVIEMMNDPTILREFVSWSIDPDNRVVNVTIRQ